MEKEENKKYLAIINLSTIILFIIFFIIPIVFFFLLDKKTEAGFGFVQIIFSIIIAFFVTFFLIWVKSFIVNRPYLGTILSLIALGLFEYGLFIKYRGPYTVTFAIIIALIVLIYTGFYFFKYRKSSKEIKVESFDDSLT
ncbi:MAG: hypothetical protein IIA87_03880 [Nanoarchaeota archaeon]|nr:hypothetical protein [Nanoarchaeota archaeon]